MKTIYLEPFEHNIATQVGVARYNARKDSKDQSYYDPARMESNFNANIASAVCEMAVAKYTNQYWACHVWCIEQHRFYSTMADVGENIEVRRVRERSNPVAIRERDVRENRIIYAAYVKAPEYEEVEILGWIDAKEGWDKGTRPDYDKRNDTRVVRISELNQL
jgi:hypothetical protein